jgi:hypothetical protein
MHSFMEPKVMQILQAVNDSAPAGYIPTITSAHDGRHRPDSLHYKDAAFDIRVKDYPGFDLQRFEETRRVIDLWIIRIKNLLSPPADYDIVFGNKQHRDHIHIEWDPELV